MIYEAILKYNPNYKSTDFGDIIRRDDVNTVDEWENSVKEMGYEIVKVDHNRVGIYSDIAKIFKVSAPTPGTFAMMEEIDNGVYFMVWETDKDMGAVVKSEDTARIESNISAFKDALLKVLGQNPSNQIVSESDKK